MHINTIGEQKYDTVTFQSVLFSNKCQNNV